MILLIILLGVFVALGVGVLCFLVYFLLKDAIGINIIKEPYPNAPIEKEVKPKPNEMYYLESTFYALHKEEIRKNQEIFEKQWNEYKNACDMIDKRNEEKLKKYHSKQNILFGVVIVISVIIAVAAGVGASYGVVTKDNFLYNKELKQYESAKYTIEKSLDNNDLSGFERLELVKQAAEKNEWLAGEKEKIHYWGNCYVDDKIKALYDKAEYIDLNKE